MSRPGSVGRRRPGRTASLRALTHVCWILALTGGMLGFASGGALAQERRFLAKEDIVLLGLGLRVNPPHQTVPKNTATIVSTFLNAPVQPERLPAFGPDTRVTATLRGPSLAAPLHLETRPNTPFDIPPLTVAGPHTLDNIRLESGGEVLLFGNPEIVSIEVIDKLLVTQVTSRPLTAGEIREKGIVFDKSSFQAYNFTAAFAIQDRPVNIDFPVVLPRLQGVEDVTTTGATIPPIDVPGLRTLKTIIPDTLKIQTQIPNLSVIGFSLQLDLPVGQQLYSFAMPGVVIVPGNIGFLNQFFSVMLLVGNVAPEGSNLVVDNLKSEISLPTGRDGVAGSGDDPLRMARTSTGDVARVQAIAQPGADGALGTADDVAALSPGDSGSAEYLVEGRVEGTHVVEMEISGTLHGLPIGPVSVRGRAAGSVLVRNPSFTLTFTHPEAVAAGEPYTLDVTVTNTSTSPANFVSVNLLSHNVSGATLAGAPTQEIESIAPGDAATVTFDLVSRVTGSVTAATLESDGNVAGRFGLKTAVGELGVQVSPDSLILPKEAQALPQSLRDAAVGLLGKAWAVATAPAGSLPSTVSRLSRQIVFDRAVEVAGAGFRVSLHEPLSDSAAQLAMDFAGSDWARLAQVVKPGDLPFVTADVLGFDELRRTSVRGDVFAAAVANLLKATLATGGAAAFHRDLAEKLSYRPAHLSVLVAAAGGALPVRMIVTDAQGRRLGGTNAQGKVTKEIRFSEFLTFADAGVPSAELATIAAPEAGRFVVRLEPIEGASPTPAYTVSVVVPDGAGGLRQIVYSNLTAQSIPGRAEVPGSPYSIDFEWAQDDEPGAIAPPSTSSPIADPAPRMVGVVQQRSADGIRCHPSPVIYPGRVIAVLFSEEVTPESAQDGLATINLSHYGIDGNAVVGVALQPGRRIALLALRDPIGPFITRQLSVEGIEDGRGQPMPSQSLPIEATVTAPGGVVSGRVLDASGAPVQATVSLFNYAPCQLGISSKSTDGDGRFTWDYVLKDINAAGVAAIAFAGDESRKVQFTVQRDGQRLNVNVVLLGRGALQGRTLSENGTPLANSKVKVTSLTDQSEYGTTSDELGRYTLANIPVGNVFVEAVNVVAKAQINLSERIPVAGGTTLRDIVLLDVDTTRVTVKIGALSGHVLRSDGATPAAGVPVIVYYRHLSQPKVQCPPALEGTDPNECPIASGTTDVNGRFDFPEVTAGNLRVKTFDSATLQQGDAGVVLPANGSAALNVLLSGGLGTVTGVVLDSHGDPVAGARVGGGLSLSVTDAAGEFVLTDVPIGRREIVAVSDALAARGIVTVDVVSASDPVRVTVVLPAQGSVAGRIFGADGTTPVRNLKVYLFRGCGPADAPGICIAATATTDVDGAYRMDQVPIGPYTLSAFNASLTDGNVAPVTIGFKGQIVRVDVRFRGGNGRVTGRVLDDDGVTPLAARLAISGDLIVSAGGLVGTGFRRVRNYAVVSTSLTTGEFAFNDLLVGAFTLSAVGQFSPDPVSLDGAIASPGQVVAMDLRLQATSRIAGTVLQPDGVTPVGANVVVRFKSEATKIVCAVGPGGFQCAAIPQGIQNETVVTDTDGRYLFPIVNPGTFTITAEDPSSGRTAQAQGVVRTGETGEVSVHLLGIGELTVRVLASDAATPIPGARVQVTQLDFPRRTQTFLADAQGIAVFGGGDAFSEGDFVVVATDLRNGFAGRASGRIGADGERLTQKIFLFNATGTVSGTVFASDGLTPAPNAELTIGNCVADGIGGCASGGSLALAVADAAGHYEVDQVPLGDFTVEVFDAATARRGFATGRIDLDGQHVPVNVVEAALGMVTGHVLAAGSLGPLKGGEISLTQRGLSGRLLPRLTGTTSVDGSFSFPGTSLGAFTLDARVRLPEPGGFGHAEGAIVREGELVDIPLVVEILRPVFGAITGGVFNADGSAAANSRVEICHAGMNCTVPLLLTADAGGRFELPHVPLGRFAVRARSQTSSDAGSAIGEIAFEHASADVVITLGGLRRVAGTVVFADGQIAPNAEVTLTGVPATGCAGACVTFTDPAGRFSYVDVPAETFTVSARHALSGLTGAVGGSLTPGETRDVRVVLQPTSSVSGRVVLPSGRLAAGIVAELVLLSGGDAARLFAETAADGTFSFPTVVIGPFRLELVDPIGPGRATRTGTAVGTVLLGDTVLDVEAPAVVATTPAAGTLGVPTNQVVQVVFSEPIDRGTVVAATVTLSDGLTTVPTTLAVAAGDTTVSLSPLAPLRTQTRYSVRVQGVKDRLGKVMSAAYVAAFTTVDVTAPQPIEITPAAGLSGVAPETTVRLRYSEPFDVTKLRAPPITVTGSAGPVDGRIDLLLGNTLIVFTPLRPLGRGAAYRVQAPAVTDLSGNVQAADLDVTFSTADGSAPGIETLVAANNGQVIENAIAAVVASTGAAHDVAFVDFYLNDTIATTDRSAPFELRFQAVPALGAAGSQIKVSAVATDTSGNRGQTPVATFVTVVPDRAPVVAISAPASGISARNGDRIVVSVRASDDLGVANIGFRAQTGKPQDAATHVVPPAVLDRTESFVFFIPDDAAPGSTIRVDASTVDTKGQVTQAAPIELTVLDAVAPAITITGLATGTKVRPGQLANAIVSAQDIGGVSSISFRASGVTAFEQTRSVDPAQTAVVVSFSFTIPAGARPGDTVNLDATAVDKAGNTTNAARLILPLVDSVPPVVTLRTGTGTLAMTPGRAIAVIAEAEDEIGITRIDITGDGAFTFADARQVTPPLGNAAATFTIQVPDGTSVGGVLNLRATATDIAGNVSDLATLSLTARSLVDISLPPSAVVAAGESQDVLVTLGSPAPAAGLRVDLVSRNDHVAQSQAAVLYAAGETSRTVSISGVAGGTTTIDALVEGVQRTSMTVTVRGGIVRGTVFDQLLNPLPGAKVTVSDVFGTPRVTVTDGAGEYVVENVNGGFAFAFYSVRVLNEENGHIGFATGTLSQAGGFAHQNVVVIPAGSVHGTVFRADGVTAVAAGVRVDIFRAGEGDPLATILTDGSGAYEFPLVTLGSYIVDARGADGSRGRASVALTASGQDAETPITFLGRGTVVGTVVDGSNRPIANAIIRFTTRTVFGFNPAITIAANLDGTYTFENVPVGEFQIEARDPVTQFAGSVSGRVDDHLQEVRQDVVVASYATIQGTVHRADGVTPVPNAEVTTGGFYAKLFTLADDQGRFRFEFVQLGSIQVDAVDPGTGGRGTALVNLTANGQVVTLDLRMTGQGTIVATVTDASGNPAPDAFVDIRTKNPDVGAESRVGVTGADGVAIVPGVLVGPFEAIAFKGGLRGSTLGTLTADEVKTVVVRLQPTGSITGTVFEPDGQTPAAAGIVYVHDPLDRAFSTTFPMAQAPVAADGTFRLDNLRLYTYNLSVRDAQGRLRALARTIVLDTPGEVETRHPTLIGLGRVNGRVVNPDSSSASGLTVEVRSQTPDFGGFATTQTNAAGFYQIDDVVVGLFMVSTGDASRQLLGEGAGQLAHHGETVTVDILLQNNAVNLPVTKWDANNGYFPIQRNGSIGGAGGDLFGREFQGTHGSLLLDVIVSGVPTRFDGAAVGTTEESGREVVTRQLGVAGLNVTRKLFVPRTGYFARFLEILSNPTASPITASVRVTSILPRYVGGADYRLVRTSSGDDVIDVEGATPDRWLVFDDIDGLFTGRAAAFVFDGAAAQQRVGALTLETNPDPFCQSISSCFSQRLAFAWNTITIPAGGSVAYLHFVSQQGHQAGALASAQRLVQLPPEALDGLSAIEIAEIQNFALPEGGNSALAPLPLLTGTIRGTLFEGDGVTPVRSAIQGVRFNSTNPFYDAEQRVSTDASGRFTISASFDDAGTSLVVPADGFVLTGRHPLTLLESPPVAGSFASGSADAAQDVSFASMGSVKGVVRRHTGAVVTTGTLTVSGPGYFVSFIPIGSDGSYVVGGLAAGMATITATVPHAQGTALKVVAARQIAGGQALAGDLVLPPTGAISGAVQTATDNVAPNVTARLVQGGPLGTTFLRTTQTDSAGAFLFADVPAGVYRIEAIDPVTAVTSSLDVAIVQDQITAQNVRLGGRGTLQLSVTFAGGAPAAQAFVRVRDTTGAFDRGFTLTATGTLTLTDVPVGGFTVFAQHPVVFTSNKTVTATMTAHGATVPVALTLPAVGSVQAQVSLAGGAPAAGAQVEIATGGSGFFGSAGITDAAGRLTIPNLLGGAFTLRARHPNDFAVTVVASGVLATEGQVAPVAVVLAAVGSIQLRVNSLTGAGVAGSVVQVRDAFDGLSNTVGTTDASGGLTIARARGTFVLQASDPSDSRFTRSAGGIVETEGQVVPVTVVVGTRGTVTGRVLDESGIAVAQVQVRLLSDNPLLTLTANADASGAFAFADVPTGRFRLRALDFSRGRAGSLYGIVPAHGQAVTADVHLGEVPLATTLTDVNGFAYQVGGSGGFNATDTFTASHAFSLTVGTTNVPFSGDFAARPEIGGRQLAIANTDRFDGGFPLSIHGLQVTRKVFVPQSGYFARYLETLENTGSTPVTVSARVDAQLVAGFPLHILTSSGDATATTADQWLIADDQGRPARAVAGFVFQGAGASQPLGETRSEFFPEFPLAGWKSVTIAPGERAAFLHFAVQAFDVASAQSAAERLVQLPPEAIAGLTPEERAAIRNFAVPADGVSELAPFTTLTGRVLAGDGATPVANAVVRLTNTSAIFPRPAIARTNAAGEYRFDTLVPGALTVQATHAVTGALSSQEIATVGVSTSALVRNLSFPGTGSIRGFVRLPGGGAATQGTVRLTRALPFFEGTVPTASDGSYSFAGLPPGQYSLSVTALNRSAAISPLVTANQVTTADMTFAARATINLSALQSDGVTPAASAQLFVGFNGGFLAFNGFLNSSGQAELVVGEGAWQIRVANPAAGTAGTITVTLSAADDGQTIPVSITLAGPVSGTATGRVTAGDGVTALPYRIVDAFDVATGAPIGTAFTDASGVYQMNLTHQAQGFRLVATDGTATAESTRAFSAAGEVLTVDLALPVSVIRGRVVYDDGVTGAPYPNVFITRTAEDGTSETFFPFQSLSDGSYGVLGVPAGPFVLDVQDSESGLSARVSSELGAGEMAALVDVTLPPSAALDGTVFDAAGSPVSQAYVSVSIPESLFTPFVMADENGRYRFERLGLGALRVQGCDGATSVCGLASATLSTAGQTVTADITLPRTGTVAGFVFAADGTTPLGGSFVTVQNDTYSGPIYDTFRVQVEAEANGHYEARGIPVGPVRVVANSSDIYELAGIADGIVAADTTTSLDVSVGGAFAFGRLNLDGADGFRYDVNCTGVMYRGGTTDGDLRAVGEGALSRLTVAGRAFPCLMAGSFEDDGRELALAAAPFDEFAVTRKIYVPESGGFARYLDAVTNHATTARTISIEVRGVMASGAATRVSVAPAATNRTFAVTDNRDGCCTPAVAFVLAGVGAAVPPQATTFVDGSEVIGYRWSVTVPAGATVRLLHFVVQRAAQGSQSARDEADAITHQTDADMLVGLSPAERAQVVNFTLP